MVVEKLYESDDYLVVNKPFDMYINSDDENNKNTVAHHTAKHDSHMSTSTWPLHFIQRLDYATSGVLCIAKNKQAAAKAGRLFEKRLAWKYYLAIVRGHVGFECCDVEYAIGEDPTTADTSHKMAAVTDSSKIACNRPRAALTRLLVLETGYYCEDPVTVVLLKPTTGRRHQLRVHCATIGHPIVGDYTYTCGKDSGPHRMFLHAIRLRLPLQEVLDIQSQEPFFKDPLFYKKYKVKQHNVNFKEKSNLIEACNHINSFQVKVFFKNL